MKRILPSRHRRIGLPPSWLLLLLALVAILTILETWASPPSWMLPIRLRVVSLMHWAKQSWLNNTTIGTIAAIMGVLTPFVIRWLDRHRPFRMTEAARDVQQRAVMLHRIRYKWITGVLEPSLARAALLILGLERRPDLLHLGVRMLRRTGRPPRPLPTGTSIGEIFDEVGGGLLILGAPGAGKTTVLLQLCDELLDRAERDLSRPVPVVMNLASWAHRRPPLGTWIVDELVSGYQVPRTIASQWMQQDALALLLDGLDEVAEDDRAACVETINLWRDDHGLVPVVICCRTQELQELSARLQLEEAVELQPPSDSEVSRYLHHLEATGTPIADVRAALTTDQELRQLLRSPLMLHVVALAYHGRAATALYTSGTLKQRQEWLWEAYIVRMFEQRPLDPGCGYSDKRALEWLVWLARTLRDRDQTEFHLDRLTPDSLSTAAERKRAHMATGLTGGLVAGSVSGLAFGLFTGFFQLTLELPDGLLVALSYGLVFGLAGWLILGLVGGLAVEPVGQVRRTWLTLGAGMAGRIMSGLQQGRAVVRNATRRSNQQVLAVMVFGIAAALGGGPAAMMGGWMTADLAFGFTAAVTGGLTAMLGGWLNAWLVGELTFAEPAEQVRWSWSKLRVGLFRALTAGLSGGLATGLLGGLMFGSDFGFAFGVTFGLTVGLVGLLAAGLAGGLRDERAMPNEGIHRSAKHALLVGLAAGLSGGLAAGLAFGLVRGKGAGLVGGLGFGLIFMVAVGLVFGGTACLQHYVVRAALIREGHAPWDYGSFLEAMAQRLLLRRSGSAYLFVHRLLRDYLAQRSSNHIKQLEV